MDRFSTAVLCGAFGAMTLGVAGAFWGGAIRVLTKLRVGVPDATLGDAFRRGTRSGAGFLAVVGGVLGVISALVNPTPEASFEETITIVVLSVLIMLIITIMIGLPSTYLVSTVLKLRRAGSPPSPDDSNCGDGDQKTAINTGAKEALDEHRKD